VIQCISRQRNKTKPRSPSGKTGGKENHKMSINDVITAAARDRLDEMEMSEGLIGYDLEGEVQTFDEMKHDVELAVDAGWWE